VRLNSSEYVAGRRSGKLHTCTVLVNTAGPREILFELFGGLFGFWDSRRQRQSGPSPFSKQGQAHIVGRTANLGTLAGFLKTTIPDPDQVREEELGAKFAAKFMGLSASTMQKVLDRAAALSTPTPVENPEPTQPAKKQAFVL